MSGSFSSSFVSKKVQKVSMFSRSLSGCPIQYHSISFPEISFHINFFFFLVERDGVSYLMHFCIPLCVNITFSACLLSKKGQTVHKNFFFRSVLVKQQACCFYRVNGVFSKVVNSKILRTFIVREMSRWTMLPVENNVCLWEAANSLEKSQAKFQTTISLLENSRTRSHAGINKIERKLFFAIYALPLPLHSE